MSSVPCIYRVGVLCFAFVVAACGGGGGGSAGGGSTPPPPGASYTIGGTITGLVGSGLALRNTNTSTGSIENLNNITSSPFEFTTALPDHSGYSVSVVASPINQVCTVDANGSGTLNGAKVTNVAVKCIDNTPPPNACANFGTNGLDYVTTTNGLAVNALVIQPGATDCEAKIVVAGTASVGSVLLRYNYDGSLDTTFGPSGSNGIVAVNFGSGTTLHAMTFDNSGRIVVAGYVFDPTISNRDFLIARYDSNGNIDTSFGSSGDGKVITDFGGREDYANAVAIDSLGRIVAAGTSCVPGSRACPHKGRIGSDMSDLVLTRYLDNGSLDPSFNIDGKVRLTSAGESFGALALVIQHGDKPLAAGFRGAIVLGIDTTIDFSLARLDSTGYLDTTFGANANGTVRTGFQTDRTDTANAIALDSQGRIVVAGTTYNDSATGGTYNDFAIARYDRNGLLDTTNFGSGTGKATLHYLPDSQDYAWALVILTGDEIEVAGNTTSVLINNTQTFFTTHLDSTGTVLASGPLSISVTNATSQANALAILPNGDLMAAGFDATNTGQEFALVRFSP